MMSHCPTVPLALQPLLKETIPVKLYRDPIGHVCNTHVVARTDLTLFLESLREYYTLAIWSSAKKKTVKSLTRMLFPEKILRELLFVWGQDKCECVDVKNLHGEGILTIAMVPFQKLHAYKGIIFMKHLSKVWHEYPMWNKSNTLLLDDSFARKMSEIYGELSSSSPIFLD